MFSSSVIDNRAENAPFLRIRFDVKTASAFSNANGRVFPVKYRENPAQEDSWGPFMEVEIRGHALGLQTGVKMLNKKRLAHIKLG